MSIIIANQTVAVATSSSAASVSTNPLGALIQAEERSLQSISRIRENFEANHEAMEKALKSAVDREAQLKKQVADLTSHLRNQTTVHAANIAANQSLIANQAATISQMKATYDTFVNQLKSIQTASVNLSAENNALRGKLATFNVPAPC